jgi:hypothetical protein
MEAYQIDGHRALCSDRHQTVVAVSHMSEVRGLSSFLVPRMPPLITQLSWMKVAETGVGRVFELMVLSVVAAEYEDRRVYP